MEQIKFGSDKMECKNNNSATVLEFLLRIVDSRYRQNSGNPTLPTHFAIIWENFALNFLLKFVKV